MLEHLNISVYGMVQGVFFRRTVRHEAERLHINGFVVNNDDGAVYIEAEADPEILESFVEWLKRGAGGESDVRVSRVETEPGPFKAYDAFEIK